MALADHGVGAGGERKRRREAENDGTLSIHLPDLLSMLLIDGKKDLGGKGTLVVPDNVRPEIPDVQPTIGVTRIEIVEGQPYIEAGRILDLLADLVSMTPTIPWIEFDNRFGWVSVRVEPWKTLTWEITR